MLSNGRVPMEDDQKKKKRMQDVSMLSGQRIHARKLLCLCLVQGSFVVAIAIYIQNVPLVVRLLLLRRFLE